MPQGTIPRGEAFFEPKLVGRWGAAKLAAATKAPVIPIGLWGTEHVWPRASRLPEPDATSRTRPPCACGSGPPVDLKYRSPQADTDRIMRAIEALLPAEAQLRRKPTAAELARSRPPS